MRRSLLSLGSATVVVWASLLTSAFSQAPAQAPTAPTVEEIVAKNIAAKGGAAKLKSIDTVRITAAATVQGVITPMTIELKRPNLKRQEVTVNGNKIVQTFDGTTGWLLNPSAGSQPIQMPAMQSAAMKEESEFDSPLLDYQSKGVKIALVGKETIDGRDAYHLKVTTKDGAVRDYYLDTSTGLEFQVDGPIEQNGQRATLSVSLSDYRDVDGVKMPFSLKQTLNGTPVADLRVSTIEINVPLDGSRFRLGDGK
jgi:outer membrane lipoprotein-sorting protein